MQYIGRFAPSPSGSLHFGSLIAALGSFLQAKANAGKWLVRIEDIDPPREVAGAASDILRTLEAYSLYWDDAVLYQSSRLEAYQAQISYWLSQGEAYHCQCTRAQIKQDGGIYSAKCRDLALDGKGCAVRVRIDTAFSEFTDQKQGLLKFDPHLAKEDFIIKRRDGLYAYNLAVVLDDIYQGVTEVVRGADLLEPTTRQLALYHKLNAPFVRYFHLPLALGADGKKLSKQNHAPAIDKHSVSKTLFDALVFLGLTPPKTLKGAPASELLAWAVANWTLA